MRYVDTFDRPGDAWRRGDAVPSRQAGPLVLSPDFRVNHVTLSGMVVHPGCLASFEARVTWRFKEDGEGRVVIALAKPHEWSTADEAPMRIYVAVGGAAGVVDAAGNELATFFLDGTSGDAHTLAFARDDGHLTLKTGRDEIDEIKVRWPEAREENAESGGYLTIQAEGVPVELCGFELNSPIESGPLTPSQRQEDIDSWLDWRMERNRRDMSVIESFIADETAGGRWGFDTDLTVSPGLVRKGEAVTLTFHVAGPLPSLCQATVEADYLGASPGGPVPLALQWRSDGGAGRVAEITLHPDRPGNWRVVWRVGGERLSRVFGVVERGYAVCTLWVGSNFPAIDDEIHRFDLPGDCLVGDWWSPFGRPPGELLEYVRPFARMRHRFGDRLWPFVNADAIMPGIPNFNLMALAEARQAEGITLMVRVWEALGIGPMEILGSYTFGHVTPRLAAKLGIKAINSLCAWQNWQDGSDDNHWKINHLAAPNAPYFVARDDLRKVAGGKSIVAFSMGTATSVRNYCIYAFEGCPTNTIPARRYTGDGAVAANIHRFHDAVDGWLGDATYNAEPLFFTVALENFAASKDWARSNALAVEYLVDRASSCRLLFASAADIADFYQRHYPAQPEHVYFQPDVYRGYRAQNKPALLPARIETSNAEFHTLHVDGRALPQFFWDYRQTWSEPEWDAQEQLRDAHGLISPDRVKDGKCVPRQVSLKGIRAAISVADLEDGVELKIELDLPGPTSLLPLAVWRVPLAGDTVEVVDVSPDTRWIKVVDCRTDNLNGVVVCRQLPAGRCVRRIRLRGVRKTPACGEFELADGKIVAGTIRRDGAWHTYLWRSDGTPPGVLRIDTGADNNVSVCYNDGEIVAGADGGLSVLLDDGWRHETPMIVGMEAAQLDGNVSFAADSKSF